MNQQTLDQGWQQLQDHIEGFVSRAFRSDLQRIEYKPRFIAGLLGMSSELQQKELPGPMAINDNFNQQGGEK